MPPKWIVCPKAHDQIMTEPVTIEECLNHCTDRCLTSATIKAMTSDRVWTGNPSTTQLLNGTMIEFLKITKDYTIDPQKKAFALLGTRHHQKLEEAAKELNLPSEIALSPDGHDVFDLLEPENGTWTLTDYKTWGSYRMVRALGIVKDGKGKDATFIINPNTVDLIESELQLNNYRIMLEGYGLKVGKMQLQVTVRDGGLQIARTRGIDFNIKLIPIKRLDNEDVLSYFKWKKGWLLEALEKTSQYLPEPCNDEECWNGARCRGWCEVAKYCPKGIMEQGVK